MLLPFASAIPALAGTIDLRWNPVGGATGYRVYHGTESGVYGHVVDAGSATSIRLDRLADCTNHYVAVKAYNTVGESVTFSNELAGWPRPRLGPAQPRRLLDGKTTHLNVFGANFQPGAATMLVPTQGVQHLGAEVLACDHLLLTLAVEPQAGPPVARSINFTLRNPDGVRSANRFIPVLASVRRQAVSLVHVDSEEPGEGAGEHAIDGDPDTFWVTEWAQHSPPPPHEITLDLGASYSLQAFSYLPRQSGSANGTIRDYEIDVSPDGIHWQFVKDGRIPYHPSRRPERVIPFPATTGRFVRLRALSEINGNPWTSVAELSFAGMQGNTPPEAAIQQPVRDLVIPPGATVEFVGASSDPDGSQPPSLEWSFPDCAVPLTSADLPGRMRFDCPPGEYEVSMEACDDGGLCALATRRIGVLPTECVPIPRTAWALVAVDSQELVGENGSALHAIDGDPSTHWVTAWTGSTAPPPHALTVDLGSVYELCGMGYLPRQDGGINGTIRQFELQVRASGSPWRLAASGVLVDEVTETGERVVAFAAVPARRVRLHALSEIHQGPWASAAELTFFARSGNIPASAVIDAPAVDPLPRPGQAVTFAATSYDLDGDLPLTRRWTFPDCAVPSTSFDEDPGPVRLDCPPGDYQVAFEACDSRGACSSDVRHLTVLPHGCAVLPQRNWVATVDSQEVIAEDGRGTNAIDDDPATSWITAWSQHASPPPHEIEIDLGAERRLCALDYLPRQDGSSAGTIRGYELAVMTGGGAWTQVAAGDLVTTPGDATLRTVQFAPINARHVRLRQLSEVSGNPWCAAAEIRLRAE